MRNRKARLVLFFVLETLAIGMMIMLLKWGWEPHCWSSHHHHYHDDCRAPSSAGLLAVVPLMLAELALVASVLRADRPIWGMMLVLGLFTPVFGVCMIATLPFFEPGHVMGTVALWHMGAGLLLFGAGVIGGVHAAFVRLRRARERRRALAGGEA